MTIHGLSKLTLLDYPEHIACTVFTGSCNFRCPFCHNAGLVLSPSSCPTIPEDEFFSFLESRKNKLEGVCITGGEPTLQKDLPEFIARIKALGFLVKLDTNGYSPNILAGLIDSHAIDMIAMDIKNSPGKYAETAGLSPECFNFNNIKESISLIKSSGIPYEFRTTVVRELHTSSDIEEIAALLGSTPAYYLQSFKDADEMICKKTDDRHFTAYSEIEMQKLLNVAKKYMVNAHIRGAND